MRILRIAEGQPPQKMHIPRTLEAMQDIVGGPLELVHTYADDCAAIICNGRGYLDGHIPNRRIWDPISGELSTVIHGTFFVCVTKGEIFRSLSRSQLRRFEKLFSIPDVFDEPYRCTPLQLIHIPSGPERLQRYLDLHSRSSNGEDVRPF